MPQPTSTLTRDTILAHERLHPRIAALLKQVERVAARRPTQPVPEESMKLSRELCREAARLLGRDGRGIGVGRGTLDHSGLAVMLGQALAGLEAFEAANSVYSAKHGAVCWMLPEGGMEPVSRLRPKERPKGPFGGKTEMERKQDKEMHAKVVQRIIRRENYAYFQGYRDAQQGKPPRTPLTEFQPVP